MEREWNPPAQVLFVADAASQLTEFAIDLMQRGYAISTALSEAEARIQLAARAWDVVIVDQRDVDHSLRVCRTVGDRAPHPPVLVLLPYAEADVIERMLAAGAYDVLLPPPFPALLHAALNRACDHYRLRQYGAAAVPTALVHDINNALSGIVGITQLRLGEPTLPHDLRDDFQQIADNAYTIRDRLRKA